MRDYYAQYVTIGIFGIVATVLVVGTLQLSRLLRPSHPSPEKLTTYESGIDPIGVGWAQTNVRYYVFALLFVIFDVEAIFLFPWAVILGELDGTTQPTATYALVAMFLFIATLLEGLAYAWKKGVLKWE